MDSLGAFNLFSEPEHLPFFQEGGRPAALLVHGFPGTPAEMRPLATELHQAGWTVEGLLLPGFGPDIDTLFNRRSIEWQSAVELAIKNLRTRYEPVVLIGFSLGGALALSAAAAAPVDRLVLLAPFWRLGNGFQALIWRLLRFFFPVFQPFRKADFASPQLRHAVLGLFPDLDMDDPANREILRNLRVPSSLVEQVRQVGRSAWQAAPQVAAPTLIVQGQADETVRPEHTRKLSARIRGPVRYQEVSAGHSLLDPDEAGWEMVSGLVLDYLHAVEG